MSGSEMPNWLKCSTAIIAAVLLGVVSEIPDFFLPTLQDPSWTPRIALVRAVAIGTAFGLIMATATILFPRSPDDVHKRSFRRAVFAFLQVRRHGICLRVLGASVLCFRLGNRARATCAGWERTASARATRSVYSGDSPEDSPSTLGTECTSRRLHRSLVPITADSCFATTRGRDSRSTLDSPGTARKKEPSRLDRRLPFPAEIA
jgi:hypothetical protein